MSGSARLLSTFAGLILLSGVAPAHALQQDVTCVGTATVSISPGLTLWPQTVHVQTNVIYSPCVSSDPTLTSGQSGSSFDVPNASCLTFPVASSGAFPISWNNGDSSTFTHNDLSTVVAGQTVLTRIGTITDGEFAGDTAVRVITYPALNPVECLTTGVSSQIGPVVLTLTAP